MICPSARESNTMIDLERPLGHSAGFASPSRSHGEDVSVGYGADLNIPEPTIVGHGLTDRFVALGVFASPFGYLRVNLLSVVAAILLHLLSPLFKIVLAPFFGPDKSLGPIFWLCISALILALVMIWIAFVLVFAEPFELVWVGVAPSLLLGPDLFSIFSAVFLLIGGIALWVFCGPFFHARAGRDATALCAATTLHVTIRNVSVFARLSGKVGREALRKGVLVTDQFHDSILSGSRRANNFGVC